MFWFKKKDADSRITFREWCDKHYKEDTIFTVIIKPSGFKYCYKVSDRCYKLDYETVAKYGNRKVVHEFMSVAKGYNEWIVVLGGK